jgi:5-methylthioadenosine/S-adenosylhomocysteine deaminase
MMKKILIKNGLVVTNDAKDSVVHRDVLVQEDTILALGENLKDEEAYIIDAAGKVVIPGFVQPHVHLTQTLFRGRADDLELMDFLKERIWKFEGRHTEKTNYLSAKLGIAELIRSGTTTILDMGTVNHQDSIFQGILESGIRAISGKCMMDDGKGVPESLMENTKQSLEESIRLLKKWHGQANGRIQYALAPRFAPSCTDELFQEVKKLSDEYGVFIHTHASENQREIEIVMQVKGRRNIEYFKHMGIASSKLILAHCVWLDEHEIDILKETDTRVVHSPNCNLKLASGFAKIPEYMKKGIKVGLATDSSASNNSLSMFSEMKTAGLIHKARLLSPTIMDAKTVFRLATIDGATVLGLENQIGSIEKGKKADLVILDLNLPETIPYNEEDIFPTIVYSASHNNVETVMIDGKILMENRVLKTLDERAILKEVNQGITIF